MTEIDDRQSRAAQTGRTSSETPSVSNTPKDASSPTGAARAAADSNLRRAVEGQHTFPPYRVQPKDVAFFAASDVRSAFEDGDLGYMQEPGRIAD